MKKAIVSFANTPDYINKMNRLENSLKGNFDGDFFGMKSFQAIGSPTHEQIPYAFKPYAIDYVRKLGYDLVLWCDSPIVATKNLDPVFKYLEDKSYAFFDNIGHTLGMWSNDKALDYFGVSRAQALETKMIMACCMGFNFKSKTTNFIFDAYKDLTELYKGSWDNHRHDQTVMSLLIRSYELDILTGQDTFFAYEQHHGVLPIAESVCLLSK